MPELPVVFTDENAALGVRYIHLTFDDDEGLNGDYNVHAACGVTLKSCILLPAKLTRDILLPGWMERKHLLDNMSWLSSLVWCPRCVAAEEQRRLAATLLTLENMGG